MNMNDYKNAVSRMRMRSELKEEIIEASVEKRKNRFSERAISIAVATTICLSAFTVVFGVARVFKDTNNLSSDIAASSYVSCTSFSATKPTSKDKVETKAFRKKAIFKNWNQATLDAVFPMMSSEYDYGEDDAISDPLLETGDGFLHWNSDSNYNYQTIIENITSIYSEDELKSLCEKIPIEGLSKNTCVELADNYINELGLNTTRQRKHVYALTEDILINTDYRRNEYDIRIDDYGNELPEWTTDQEAYLITYEQSYGLPLVRTGYEYSNSVIIGKNGLAHLLIVDAYEFIDDATETVNICSSDKAAEAICEFFSKYLGYTIDITDINKNCRLVYVVEDIQMNYIDSAGDNHGYGFIFKPYWEFHSEKLPKSLGELGFKYSGYIFNDSLIIDAVTCIFDDSLNFTLN